MAVGYTRFKLRLQHSPNSDYTDPNMDELITVSLGQTHRVVLTQEKSFTTQESIISTAVNAGNILVIQNLSATVTILVTLYSITGAGTRTFTIPASGFAVYPGVDVSQSTIGGTADAACTARLWVFSVTDTAS